MEMAGDKEGGREITGLCQVAGKGNGLTVAIKKG